MRVLFAMLALLAVLAGPAAAAGGPVSAADGAAIQSVISGQIDAFRRDDGAGAFGFAAPSTQGVFGSADTFMQMVRRGYAPVYRPRSVDFAALEEEDGQIVQNVELTGPDGLAYTARYTMEHESDGSWRIVGCAILQSRRLGV
jgi:DNA-binding transcriptional LysR family regulator